MTIPMPGPVAYVHVCRKKPELRNLLYEKDAPELAVKGFIPYALITTAQAEAYADARVREVLEGVIQRLDAEIAVAREHKAYAAVLALMSQAVAHALDDIFEGAHP